MKFALTAKRPELADSYPNDAGEHASLLKEEFDAVDLWLQQNPEQYSGNPNGRIKKSVSLGIKKGVASGLEDIPYGIRKNVDEEFVQKIVDRELSKELSKGLGLGVRKDLFDQLYKSYAELNTKLAAKDESAGDYNSRSHQRLPERLPRASMSPCSTRRVSDSSARRDGRQVLRSGDGVMWRGTLRISAASSDFSEDDCEESSDRCCRCGTSTAADLEEIMITTCCSKYVGSVCFDEALQETGRCCLCHNTRSRFESGTSVGHSEQELSYKFHFADNQNQVEESKKDNSVSDVASQSETGAAYASWVSLPPFVHGKSAEPPEHLRETSMWTARTSEACQSEDTAPPPGKDSLSDLGLEPSTILHEQSLSHQAVPLPDPQESDPETPPITKEYEFVLRLSDQAVISYLEGLSTEGVWATVDEALGQLLTPTIRTETALEVSLLESGDIQLTYGVCEGRALGLEQGAMNLVETLEKFVRARLQPYLVVVYKVETKTMNLSDKVQKTRAIEELVGVNASTMQFLRRPDDVGSIRWTMSEKRLQTARLGSIAIGFATAAQANGVITHRLLWKGKRRYCVKQGPKRTLVQCDNCQAFGHTAEDCTSSPRCQTCAEGHESKDCPFGPGISPKSLKCALCSGRHSARNYCCTVRRGEENRLQLENRLYPMDADNQPAASATTETKTSSSEQSNNNPLIEIPSSQVSNDGLYSDVGNETPVMEQQAPFAAFDKEIILQQPDGFRYAVPARLVDSSFSVPFDSSYVG